MKGFRDLETWPTRWPPVPALATENTPLPAARSRADVVVTGTLTFPGAPELDEALVWFDRRAITESFSSRDFDRRGHVLVADFRTEVAGDFPVESILSSFRTLVDSATFGGLEVGIGAVVSHFRLPARRSSLNETASPLRPPGALRRFGRRWKPRAETEGTDVIWWRRHGGLRPLDPHTRMPCGDTVPGNLLALSGSGRYALLEADGVLSIVRSDGESAQISDAPPPDWATRYQVGDRGYVLRIDRHDLQCFGSDGRKRFELPGVDFDAVVPGPGEVFVARRARSHNVVVRYEDGEITRLDLPGTPYFIGSEPASQAGTRVHLAERTIELVTADGTELPQPTESGWVTRDGLPAAWNAEGWPVHDVHPGRIALHGDLLLTCQNRDLLLRNWRTEAVLLRGRLAEPPEWVTIHDERVVALVGGRLAMGGLDGRWRETPQLRTKDAVFDPDGVLVSLHPEGLRRWPSLGDVVPAVTPLSLKGAYRVAADQDGFAILAGSSVHCFAADGVRSWEAPARHRGSVLGLTTDRVAVLRGRSLCLLNRADGEQVSCIDVHVTACATDGVRWAVASPSGVQIVDRNGVRECWLQGVDHPRSLAWDGDVLAIAGEDTLLFDLRGVDAMGGHPVDEWIVRLV